MKWENIAKVATVVEVDAANRALVKVKIAQRVSDFLPVLMFANSFKTVWEPLRVNEQVLVVAPFGDADSGFVVRGIYNKGCKESSLVSENAEVTEYEDGTVVMYDTATSSLFVNAVGDVTIHCKNATVEADTLNIKATTSHDGSVDINGSVTLSGDLSVGGSITDVKGDLTSHTHPGVSAR